MKRSIDTNMNTQLAQLFGMIRYEFRLQWRQRGLKVMFLSLLLVQAFGALLINQMPQITNAPPEQSQRLLREVIASEMWIVPAIFLVILIPIVVAEAIPRDRQLGVRELLDSLPLHPGIYVAGKLLGTWVIVGAGTSLVLLVTGPLFVLAGNPIDLVGYLSAATVGVWVLIVMNCGLTVLAAAGQPGTLRGMLVGFVCVFIIPLAIVGIAGPYTWADLLSSLRLPMWWYSPQDRPIVLFGTGLSTEAVFALAITGGLVELAAVWFAIRWWMRRQEKA